MKRKAWKVESKALASMLVGRPYGVPEVKNVLIRVSRQVLSTHEPASHHRQLNPFTEMKMRLTTRWNSPLGSRFFFPQMNVLVDCRCGCRRRQVGEG